MIDQFFEDYIELGPEKSLDNLYSTMPWVESIQDDVDKLKAQFTDLKNVVGDYYGHDLMAQKVLANNFSIHIYFVRFDRQPVRFIFRFYRPDKAWGLYGFSYDDSLDADLEEAVRLEYINAKD